MTISRTSLTLASLLPALLGMAPQDRVPAPKELWIFFSPGDPDFTKTLAEVQGLVRSGTAVRLRPVFLVDDHSQLKHPSEALAQNVKGLRALIGEEFAMRVWDDDGLAIARALRLERLPAVVLVDRDRAGAPVKAHVAYGAGVNLKELCQCDE